MRRVLAILILALAMAGAGLYAQETGPPRDKITDEPLTHAEFVGEIRERLAAILRLYHKDKKDTAYRALALLTEEVKAQETFLNGHTAFWWPDLIMARLKRQERDHAAVETATIPIVQALDTDRFRSSNTRLEAMLLLTKSLYTQKKYEEADIVARGLVRDAPDDFKPKWQLEAESYLALAASRSGVADAAALRAALLDGYLDREHATVKNYVFLWKFDLKQRRSAKADREALITDARFVLDFIRTNPEAKELDNTGLEGDLARIFAEGNDFKRAEPLLRKQLTAKEPGSVAYYWAWQNILAMNYRQKKYTQVMKESAVVLAGLEGKGDDYARVTSYIERFLAASARKLGETALYLEAIQRSYVAIRRVRSANHADTMKVREAINIKLIDPDSFQYAEELGVVQRQVGKLTLRADGSSVLQEFFDGRAISLGRRLKSFAKKNETSALGQLNLGLFHALMGEIGPADEALQHARALARTGSVKSLPANSPWFDIFLTITHSWARDWDPEKARDPIARLMARTDLTPDQMQTLHILRMLLERSVDDFESARQVYEQELADFDPRDDSSPWGVFRALSILYPLFEIAPEDARALLPHVRDTILQAGSPKLAGSLLPVYLANSDGEFLNSERNFQAMAFHLKSLSRMLPPDHQTQVVAKINYAYGLWNRGDPEQALKLLTQAIRTYRTSPWHRADVVGFLEVQKARLHYDTGNFDLANTVVAQTYAAMEPAQYRPIYWQEVVSMHAALLSLSGQPQEALKVTEAAVKNTSIVARLGPFERSNLLRTHASILEANELYQQSLEWLARARSELPSPDYRSGAPLLYVLEQSAYLNYTIGDFAAAYQAMAQVSDIYFRSREGVSDADVSEALRNKSREIGIVVDQAHFAWNLAQQLQAADTAQ